MTTGLVGQNIKDETLTDADVATANKDGAAATPSMRTLGTGALQACAGNDADMRSGARTPTGHVASHVTGADKFLSTDVIEAIVKRLYETGGATLLLGAWADGQYVKRSGTAAVGGTVLECSGTTKITVGITAPGSPNVGDLWVDTN